MTCGSSRVDLNHVTRKYYDIKIVIILSSFSELGSRQRFRLFALKSDPATSQLVAANVVTVLQSSTETGNEV